MELDDWIKWSKLTAGWISVGKGITNITSELNLGEKEYTIIRYKGNKIRSCSEYCQGVTDSKYVWGNIPGELYTELMAKMMIVSIKVIDGAEGWKYRVWRVKV